MNRVNQPQTVLDALVTAIRRAGTYNPDAELAPLAILWPDGGRQWERAVPALRDHLPILTLGDFQPDARTGPAIWIRAELAAGEERAATPIIYVPGVSRDAFRNVEDAPATIQPLLSLQYRGAMFLQPNGREWTVAAFLQNARHGLGIKVDGSEATRSTLVSAAPVLLERRVADLREHPGGIDADFLSALLISDLPLRILEWMNDPPAARGGLDDARWGAFCQQMRDKYRLDPERDGPSEAARLLGSAEVGSYWIEVWDRFAGSPATFPAIPNMLRGAKPGEATQPGLFGSAASNYHWPQDNEAQEDSLRQALTRVGAPPEVARQTILDLERVHAPRRACVWATLGQAPLAFALEHLATIAKQTAQPFPAGDVATMQAHYAETGWRIDAAALDALRLVTRAADREAVETTLDAVYTPWLWGTAERFQEAMRGRKIPGRPAPLAPLPGTCVLFADGLRYDLAALLTERLAASGMTAEITASLGPLPGVTPSAKPAQSPVADVLMAGPKLNVQAAATGSAMNQTALRKLLTEAGWAFLAPGDAGAPDGVMRTWTELGAIDSYGHNHHQDLPGRVRYELQSLHARIEALLTAGWDRVVVVTDHGWLLTPRPMPKTDLPQHLTVERKGRCARLEPGAKTSIQTVPWCWDGTVAIAMAPGISCFEDGKWYEHGGLSLQECVLPTITVAATQVVRPPVTFGSVSWRGLRCLVAVDGAAGLTVDIRQKAGDAASSLAANVQQIGADGKAGILIEDDSHEGSAALVVVLDGKGNTIAQRPTIIGGE